MEDKEYIEAYSRVEECIGNYKLLDKKFQYDMRIIKYMLIKSVYYFNYIPLELRQDKNFIKEIVDTKLRLDLLDSNMKDDKEIVKLYIDHDSGISTISERLKKDIDLLTYAVLKNNKNYHSLPEDLKNDKNYIVSLVSSGANIYDFLYSKFKKDVDIINLVLQPEYTRDNSLYKVACELKKYPDHIKWQDKSFIKDVLEKNDEFWKKIPANTLNFDDILLLLRKNNKRILYHLPRSMLSDINNMNILVENIINGEISLKNHDKTIFNAILRNSEYIKNFKKIYNNESIKGLNNDVILESLYNQVMKDRLMEEIEITNKQSKKLKF